MSANERQRQRHTAKFKAKLIADLLEGKVGVGALAKKQGLSPGMLHRWGAKRCSGSGRRWKAKIRRR